MAKAPRVAVIGGGAIGLTAAFELARDDVAVTVFERDELGSGATGRAAGICYDAYVKPRDARIAFRSLEWFNKFGLLTDHPYVWFARDTETAAAVESQAKRMEAIGRQVSVLDSQVVSDRFPGLVADDIITAAIADDAGSVDTEQYVETLAKMARSEGVDIQTETKATVTADERVETSSETHEFDSILVAAGAGTAAVLSETAVDLALGIYRTQVLAAEPAAEIPMFYDVTGEYYARPTRDGILAGDGSHRYEGDPTGFDRTADEGFLTDRHQALQQRIEPAVTTKNAWAGLCTATPDGNPLLGSCTASLYVATGLCGHGLMRAPAFGKAIAEQINGGEGIPAFDPTRFDGSETISLPTGVTE